MTNWLSSWKLEQMLQGIFEKWSEIINKDSRLDSFVKFHHRNLFWICGCICLGQMKDFDEIHLWEVLKFLLCTPIFTLSRWGIGHYFLWFNIKDLSGTREKENLFKKSCLKFLIQKLKKKLLQEITIKVF